MLQYLQRLTIFATQTNFLVYCSNGDNNINKKT